MSCIKVAFQAGFRASVEQARRVAIAITLMLGVMAAPEAAAQDGQSQEEQGLVTYLGVLPAALAKGHDPTHAESTMHAGAPAGRHEYHLLVAVFEASTGLRISDAEVFAIISGLGHVGGTRILLEPMKIANTTTYGNFVSFPGADLYTIKVTVRRSGAPHAVAFQFSYDHRTK